MKTYRVIRFASLAKCLRNAVDLFNHFGKIYVQLIEPVLQLLGKLVSAGFVSYNTKGFTKANTYVLSRS